MLLTALTLLTLLGQGPAWGIEGRNPDAVASSRTAMLDGAKFRFVFGFV